MHCAPVNQSCETSKPSPRDSRPGPGGDARKGAIGRAEFMREGAGTWLKCRSDSNQCGCDEYFEHPFTTPKFPTRRKGGGRTKGVDGRITKRPQQTTVVGYS
eukprot:1607532-Rhodomonas_salina.3